MRTLFYEQLSALSTQVGEMCGGEHQPITVKPSPFKMRRCS